MTRDEITRKEKETVPDFPEKETLSPSSSEKASVIDALNEHE